MKCLIRYFASLKWLLDWKIETHRYTLLLRPPIPFQLPQCCQSNLHTFDRVILKNILICTPLLTGWKSQLFNSTWFSLWAFSYLLLFLLQPCWTTCLIQNIFNYPFLYAWGFLEYPSPPGPSLVLLLFWDSLITWFGKLMSSALRILHIFLYVTPFVFCNHLCLFLTLSFSSPQATNLFYLYSVT